MAVVARPLAHPSARLGIRMLIPAALLLLIAAGASGLDVGLDPYRQAAQTRQVGIVAGRIFEESRTPDGPVRPLGGATVNLLPRSAELLTALERFRDDARSSSKAFAAAAPAMRKAQEALERQLVVAGAPDLAPRVAVDADGTFRLTDVPAGAWLVLVWHGTPFDVAKAPRPPRDRLTYLPGKRTTGFQAVTLWLREITVAPNETVSLELTDRNGWFRGVFEESLDAGR